VGSAADAHEATPITNTTQDVPKRTGHSALAVTGLQANAAPLLLPFPFVPLIISGSLKNLIYPKLRLSWLPAMLRFAAVGSFIAGVYGIIHDQVTYSIGPEYFTRLKFAQFSYADFGLPARVFVGEVGFLATWWVGFVSGWFLARITLPVLPLTEARREFARGFAIILGSAATAFVIGLGIGLFVVPGVGIRELADRLGVENLRSFARVAYIHNAGYAGAFVGLVIALALAKRAVRKAQHTDAPPNKAR
jgi:hypothetical protein